VVVEDEADEDVVVEADASMLLLHRRLLLFLSEFKVGHCSSRKLRRKENRE
jgi:hypothetical protein